MVSDFCVRAVNIEGIIQER